MPYTVSLRNIVEAEAHIHVDPKSHLTEDMQGRTRRQDQGGLKGYTGRYIQLIEWLKTRDQPNSQTKKGLSST